MEMDGDVVEHTLYVNRCVKVYCIPPRPGAGGHRSGEWRVADEIFSGRLRMLSIGEKIEIRLENTHNGELFAMCPFTPATQAIAVEPASDSSRYFVLRVEDPATKRHAFLGLGFAERGEAFDFNAAMADHARHCQREVLATSSAAAAAAAAASGAIGASSNGSSTAEHQDAVLPALYKDPGDLSLREGQTIRIDVHKRGPSGGGGFLARAAPTAGPSLSVSADGCPKLLPLTALPPPLPQPARSGSFSASGGAQGAADPSLQGRSAPAAVTVAATEDKWATFD